MVYWIRRLTGNPAVGIQFDLRQQLFVQLSQHTERWRGGHGNQVGAKLTVEAQLVIAENTVSVGHCVIPLSIPSL